MNKKVELVLNELIQVYLTKSEPLSSTKLKEIANLPFSASSIRSYLKKLEENELVEKEHFSSGSYPSVKAMKSFWRDSLKNRTVDDEIDLREKAEELDIYVMIEMFENQLLVNVYNLNNKFIVLEFEKDEVVFKYDDNLYTLFKSVKGILLDELRKYLLHIGLKKEYESIKKLYKYEAFNKKFIYKEDINTESFEKFNFSSYPKGISFFDDYLIFKTMKNSNNVYKNILLVGNIYTDFFEVTKPVKGGE
ncbi:putative heat-inducible transcription repressor HrcA [Nautilia profundicola AmH]|uniref:Heat-inducible transcription repressor HrcA n=1 Tax=Nautilia profundicola (strain ATCC BAA-1463 / DSM 18972 / AmH) TaxID=598659 RepID=B9L8Y8_NAUPA|nr:HrcA family transcriptional regulator [Nautilia profundicola]ACM93389.1 putative heat-inducible transcription repressor HrcA [Nautilia profundicola AmH]